MKKKSKRETQSKQGKETVEPSPVRILPVHGADRLERVKQWLRLDQSSRINILRHKFPDKVAAIISRTYAECGDGATLPDDIALMKIRDLLLELSVGIINQNKRTGRS